TVSDGDEKSPALRIISEETLRDRWDDCRPPNETEMRQTSVLSLPIDEASARVSRGPSEDEPEDLDLETWAGVLPLVTHVADPAPAPDLAAGIARPGYLPRGALGRRL
ncbi:MAG: pyridoxamine 5'-phosphate oxidase family protein, partial [Actinobacteria bacterium ATB1]|nr:pyridoxamine 5'-phosphate oxidase family protein [Actinobacteria bacterium ATB1]